MKNRRESRASRFTDALKLIPAKWREIFTQYFQLARDYQVLNESKWKDVFPEFETVIAPTVFDPDSPNLIEKNPITYLINTHNTLVDFPGALNRILKLIYYQKKTPLSEPEFFIILDKVRHEAETQNRLTPVLKELFRVLILNPYASVVEVAKEMDTTEQSVRSRISRFRDRFILNRIIQLDYYKWGLSRVFLFLIFRNRRTFTPFQPVTSRYFENEIPHRLDVFSELFTIQKYYPPRRRWSALKKRCEEQVNPKHVDWLGGEPMLFFTTDFIMFYNLDTYDKTLKRWSIDEEYLDIVLATQLWEDLPRVDIPPTLHYSFDPDTPRLPFDLLDLKIAHYFYELEGNNNRFSTIGTVAKELGVTYYEVQTRLRRLLEAGMVSFRYFTEFRLPRSVDVILLTEDPKICDHYLNIVVRFPCSHTVKLRSYPAKFHGIYSTIYLPHATRVPYIFRDFFIKNQEVVTGFCAETPFLFIPKRPLWWYWNLTRNQWRWNDLPEN